MNPRAWRITTWWGKLIYVFGAWFVAGRVLQSLWGLAGVSGGASLALISIFDIGVLLIGARIFRGKGEPIVPRRPWWQMTARKKLSRRLGIWLTVFTVLLVGSFVLSFFHPVRGSSHLDIIVSVLSCGIPAYLYLNSAAHLTAEPKPDQFPMMVHL